MEEDVLSIYGSTLYNWYFGFGLNSIYFETIEKQYKY